MPKLIKIYLFIEYYIKDTIQLFKDIRKQEKEFYDKIEADYERERNDRLLEIEKGIKC